jgi:LuxR family maltose regulon positive regulatory protein
VTAVLDREAGPTGIDEVYDLIDQHVNEIAEARQLINARAQQIADLHRQAAALVAEREARCRTASPEGALSYAERRVATYLRTAMTAAEISRELYLSVNTVKTHMKHIYAKLEVKSRAEAVAALASPGPKTGGAA